MIKVKQALNIILKHARSLGSEKIDISNALGRVLAENISSDLDLPPFTKSMMDGFAINSKDPATTFEIIEDIPAGKVPKKKIKTGQCARIMTGAMLPTGADRVVMVEKTKLIGKNKLLITAQDKKSNISPRGEDVKRGQRILPKGAKVRPQEVAMLASVGKNKVKVSRQPRVAVISTGSELVEPTRKPGTGQIRNSNGPMLLVQLKRRGLDAKYLGIAQDNFAATKKLIKKGLAQADLLIMSGGVSVGDYDFVRQVLKSCGIKIHFYKVAIKPGKPTVFGTKGKQLVFGLPGNPVSVLVIFELFVLPAIDQIVGRKTAAKFTKMKILKDFKRRSAGREQYCPVLLSKRGVLPLEFHGSAHMQALTLAGGIMQIERGTRQLKKGTTVRVRPI